MLHTGGRISDLFKGDSHQRQLQLILTNPEHISTLVIKVNKINHRYDFVSSPLPGTGKQRGKPATGSSLKNTRTKAGNKRHTGLFCIALLWKGTPHLGTPNFLALFGNILL